MKVNFKKMDKDAIVPTRGSAYAAGLDLYARIPTGEVEIPPFATVKIGTGIAMEIPHGYFGAIYARSGLATKYGLRPANAVGVVDADFRAEIIVALHNDSGSTQTIHNGDRIAQLVVTPCLDVQFNEVEELSETERGEGGFGSTGISSEKCLRENYKQESLFDKEYIGLLNQLLTVDASDDAISLATEELRAAGEKHALDFLSPLA